MCADDDGTHLDEAPGVVWVVGIGLDSIYIPQLVRHGGIHIPITVEGGERWPAGRTVSVLSQDARV